MLPRVEDALNKNGVLRPRSGDDCMSVSSISVQNIGFGASLDFLFALWAASGHLRT